MDRTIKVKRNLMSRDEVIAHVDLDTDSSMNTVNSTTTKVKSHETIKTVTGVKHIVNKKRVKMARKRVPEKRTLQHQG